MKQQIGMMDARSSQMLDEEEYSEMHYTKEGSNIGIKSAQMSVFSGFTSNVASVRTNQHKNDIRKLERDRKESNEVAFFPRLL